MMHLRTVLKGMLKRTNSHSHSTRSDRSADRSNSATAESQPTSSGGITSSRNRSHLNIQDSTTATTTSLSSKAVDREGDQSHTANDNKGQLGEHQHPHQDLGPIILASERQSLGPTTDRRLPEEAKLHIDQRELEAEAPSAFELEASQAQASQALYTPDADSDEHQDTGACHGQHNPTVLVHCPTADRADSHLGAAQEPLKQANATSTLPRTSASPSSSRTNSVSLNPPAVSPGTEVPLRLLPSHPAPAPATVRRQSLVNGANTSLLRSLLDPASSQAGFDPIAAFEPTATTFEPVTPAVPDYFSNPAPAASNFAAMLSRKIWVKRPGASPTMVSIKEDDMVDDVRDMVMRKYANSLGRSFDSPDVTLRIVTRPDGQHGPTERLLAPDEDMCRTLDSYYPGGQKADEALLIDVPARRTPRPSPRAYHHQAIPYHALDDFRPPESGTDYFPPMPAVIPPSAPHSNTSASADARAVHPQALHADPNRSIAVLSTGQLPPLPSPGSVRRHRDHRPKYGRQHTSSPTILSTAATANPNLTVNHHLPIRTRPRLSSNASEKHPNGAPAAPPLPTPPVPNAPAAATATSTPPTPAVKEQNTLRPARPRRSRKPTPTNSTPTVKSPQGVAKPAISSLLDNSVPPINVLIVEDNIINLKLLEAFMKRLKVRWSTAMNGQIAVDKWRAGGFHLVLMDIQLPIMSGLEATKEIRRLERVNGIGVFSNSAPGTPAAIKQRQESVDGTTAQEQENVSAEEQLIIDAKNDKLNVENGLFKSPVIIVALTASSLQSDRHEALAAGCNDFLTKPVNFVWLERKVKEWGCMQALIDFDGWRKWKDFASSNAPKVLSASAADTAAKAKERKAKRASRASLEAPRITNSDATASSTQNGSAIVTEETPQEAT